MRSTIKAAKSRLARFDASLKVYSFATHSNAGRPVKRVGVVRLQGGSA